MYCRIFISALFVTCLLLGSCSTYEAKTSNDFEAGSKDDIFIDEAQADTVEGSAVAGGEFPDLDEEASGRGPDDEDAFEGSAEGSGAGVVDFSVSKGTGRSGIDHPVTPEPTRKVDTTKKTEPPLKKPSTIKPYYEETPPPVPSTSAPKVEGNRVQETPPKAAPPPPRGEQEPTSKSSPPGQTNVDDNETDNEIHIMGRKADERPTSFFSQPGILAAVIGGAVVGLLCAILLVMFIVYRMRKKDEGSYALEEPKRSPRSTSYQPPNKEFYA